jgi:hypothetical protein
MPCRAWWAALGAGEAGGLVEFESAPEQAAIPERRPTAANVITPVLMTRPRDVVTKQ